jgi:hypothetical protein
MITEEDWLNRDYSHWVPTIRARHRYWCYITHYTDKPTCFRPALPVRMTDALPLRLVGSLAFCDNAQSP